MKWLAPFRNKLVLGGAVVAGTAGAAVGCVMSGAAVTAWSVLGGAFAVGTNIFSNWASETVRPRPGDGGTHRNLKRTLARALRQCLAGDSTQPGPLLTQLRAPELDLQHTADLVAYWRRHIDAALDAPDPVTLDELFPGITADRELLALVTDPQPDKLWLAVYRGTLGRWSGDSYLVTLCGGVERLERQFPAALAATLPAQFAEVLKDGDSRRSWIAFQKAMLQEVRAELQTQSAAAIEQRNTIDALLARFDDVCEEQRRQLERIDVRFDRIDDCVRAVADTVIDNTRLLNDIRDTLRAEHDPPLYIPERDAQALGVRALRFSERLCATLGRDDELQRLDAFLDADAPLLWWGIVGAAGMGKSHLGLHLVEQRAHDGWHAGFLEGDTQWLSAELHLHHWQPRAPTLIVVDYASARAPQLLTLITRLYERRGTLRHRVRLLLLDRPGALAPAFAENVHLRTATEDNWSRAQRCLHGSGKAPADVADPLDAFKDATLPASRLGDDRLLSLDALDRGHWRPLLQHVLRRFGSETDLPQDDHALWQQLAQISDDGRPLLLLVAAGTLAVAHRDGQPLSLDRSSRDRLIGGIIERDRRAIWADAAGIPRVEWVRDHRTAFERGIAFVTLLGGLVWSDAAQRTALATVMGHAIDLHSPLRHELAAILGWNDREHALRPLEPDLFGEYLLVDGARPGYFGESVFSVRDLMQPAFALRPLRCAEVVGRIARDFPKHGPTWIAAGLAAAACTRPVSTLIELDFGTLLDDGFVAAAQTLVEAVIHSITSNACWPEEIDAAIYALAAHDPRYSLGVQSGLSLLIHATSGGVADQILARSEAIGNDVSLETVFARAAVLANAVHAFSARRDDVRMRQSLAQLDALAPIRRDATAEPWRYAAIGAWTSAALVAIVDFAKDGDASAAAYYSTAIVTAIDFGYVRTWSPPWRTALARAIFALIAYKKNIGLDKVDTWVERLAEVAAICIESADLPSVLACLDAFHAVAVQSFDDVERTHTYADEIEKLLAFASTCAGPEHAAPLARCASVAVLSIPRDDGVDRRDLLELLRGFVDRSFEPAAHLTGGQASETLAGAIDAYLYVRDFESVQRRAEQLAKFQDAHTIDNSETLRVMSIAMANLVCAYGEIEASDRAVEWMHRLWRLRVTADVYLDARWESHGIRALDVLLPVLIRKNRVGDVMKWLQRIGEWARESVHTEGGARTRAVCCAALALHALDEKTGPRRIREAMESFVGGDASFVKSMSDEARTIFAHCVHKIVVESANDEYDVAQRWCRILISIVPDTIEAATLALEAVVQAMYRSTLAREWKTIVDWASWVRETYATNDSTARLTVFASWACGFTAAGARDGQEVGVLALAQWAALFDEIDVRVDVVPPAGAHGLTQSLCLALEAFDARGDTVAIEDAEQRARRIIAKLAVPQSTDVRRDLATLSLRAVRRTRADATLWSALVRPHLLDEDWPHDAGDCTVLADLASVMTDAAEHANDRTLLDAWEPVSERLRVLRNRNAAAG